jgi:hypothetical protein
MIEKSSLWITLEEGEQIITEILGTKKGVIGFFPKKKKYDDARLLFIDRCTVAFSPRITMKSAFTGIRGTG